MMCSKEDGIKMDELIKQNYLYLPVNEPLNFLSAGKFILTEKWRHSNRVAESYEFIVGLSGILHLVVDGNFLEIKEDDFVIIPPGSVYSGYQYEKGNLSFFWCHFTSNDPFTIQSKKNLHSKIAKKYNQEPFILLPLLSNSLNVPRIHIPMNQLLYVNSQFEPNRFHLNYLLTSILFEITDDVYTKIFSESNNNHSRNISLVQQWIKVHCHENIKLNEIAAAFNYNKSYLSRVFSSQVGQTISSYTNEQRILKSKELLLTSTKNIQEISVSCGFKDTSYYLRLFKESEGITPSEFRNTYKTTILNND